MHAIDRIRHHLFRFMKAYQRTTRWPLTGDVASRDSKMVAMIMDFARRSPEHKTFAHKWNLDYVNLPNCPAEVLTPAGMSLKDEAITKQRWILHIHGGAFCFLSARQYRPFYLTLAERSDACLMSVDYRLSPQHIYPSALNDVLDAYRWLREKKIPASQISIMGDSAGGNLALSAVLKCISESPEPEEVIPACIGCFSPWIDLTASHPSHNLLRDRDMMFEVESIQRAALLYAFGEVSNEQLAKLSDKKDNDVKKLLSDPFISPAKITINKDTLLQKKKPPRKNKHLTIEEAVAKLPPLLVQCGSHEILLSESLAFVGKVNLIQTAFNTTNISVEDTPSLSPSPPVEPPIPTTAPQLDKEAKASKKATPSDKKSPTASSDSSLSSKEQTPSQEDENKDTVKPSGKTLEELDDELDMRQVPYHMCPDWCSEAEKNRIISTKNYSFNREIPLSYLSSGMTWKNDSLSRIATDFWATIPTDRAQLKVYNSLYHCFQIFEPYDSRAVPANLEMAQFIKTHTPKKA